MIVTHIGRFEKKLNNSKSLDNIREIFTYKTQYVKDIASIELVGLGDIYIYSTVRYFAWTYNEVDHSRPSLRIIQYATYWSRNSGPQSFW